MNLLEYLKFKSILDMKNKVWESNQLDIFYILDNIRHKFEHSMTKQVI